MMKSVDLLEFLEAEESGVFCGTLWISLDCPIKYP